MFVPMSTKKLSKNCYLKACLKQLYLKGRNFCRRYFHRRYFLRLCTKIARLNTTKCFCQEPTRKLNPVKVFSQQPIAKINSADFSGMNQSQKQILPKNTSLLYCENNFHDFNERIHKHDFINILLSFQLIFFLIGCAQLLWRHPDTQENLINCFIYCQLKNFER